MAKVGSFEGHEGESAPRLYPAAGVLLAIFGIPWLIEVSPQSLPASSYGVLPVCMFTFKFAVYKDTHYMGLGPTPMTSPSLSTSAKTPFPNRITLQGTES